MATPLPTSAQPIKNDPLRLLLVEDHEATLHVLQRLLSKEGYRVVTAACVADALEAATHSTFDLVISDLGLPDGSGIELMQTLRVTYGLSGIALTGYGMENDLAESEAAGFFAHLLKPVEISQLRRLLQSRQAK